jgi:hypothetical protein
MGEKSIERTIERIDVLKQELEDNLESTGLVTKVEIGGRLDDQKNPLYLKYRRTENTKENQSAIRLFHSHLAKVLTTNYQIITGIKKDYHEHGPCKEIILVNPQAQFDEETEIQIRQSILQAMRKEVRSYLERGLY